MPKTDLQRTVRVKHGLDVPFVGVPREMADGRSVPDRVAAVGTDYESVRWEPLVAEGDTVEPGAPLLRDRADAQRVLTSWVCGSVSRVNIQPDGQLGRLELEPATSTPSFAENLTWSASQEPDTRKALQNSGLWWALRTRPFDDTPAADGSPKAIFATAIDTRPGAPNPRSVIESHLPAFRDGVTALRDLTDGPVYVCQGEGPSLTEDAHSFLGPHPAGLVGTHIHHLAPIEEGDEVWHINYQDTIAVGYLRSWGKLWCDRVITVAGSGARDPRTLETLLGAPLRTLSEPAPGARVLSGSALDGSFQPYLGRYHLQATALTEGRAPSLMRPTPMDSTSLGGAPGPMHSVGRLEDIRPHGAEPLPLLRALSTGDTEKIIAQGGLGMVEEDLALLSFACPSKTSYGPLLRRSLDAYRGSVPRPTPLESPPSTTVAPHIRSAIDGRKIGLARTIAAGLALLIIVATGSPIHLGFAVLTIGAFLGWHGLFSKVRGRPMVFFGVVPALLMALLLPATAPLWHVALGASVACILGDEVLGGPGFGFIHPAVLGSAFLAIAFSGVGYDAIAVHPAAALPGGLFLLLFRFTAWRSIVATVLGFALCFSAFAENPHAIFNAPWLGGLFLGVLFLAGDPDTTASTRWGRWLMGVGVGALWAVEASQHQHVSAYPLLLGSLFAPLIDSAAVALQRRRQRRD